MPTEKELDRALHASLEHDQAFRAWFVRQLSKGLNYPDFVSCRSDHPWGKVRAILADPTSGALRAQAMESETDVLLILTNSEGAHLGVHIENKKLGGSFTDNQPELYAARAEAWRGSEHHGSYDEWETVLIAPAAFISAYPVDARKFITRVTHEQLADRLPIYAARSAA